MQEELPETFSEKHPLFIKIIILTLGIFLLILVLVYFLTTPQIRSIISGLIESSKVNNLEVELKSGNKLIFTNSTYEELTEIYNNNPELEFKVCLKGYIKKDYFVIEIFKPDTYLQTHNLVSAEPCPSDSIVSLHSHPLKYCLPSDIDLKNFNILKTQNSQALMAVMCEKDRFNFY